MKFVSFRSAATTRIGVLDGDAVIDLNAVRPDIPADLTEALASGADLVAAGEAALASDAPRIAASGLKLAPVVPRPGKIVCLGLNYFDHAKEGGREKPDYPWFFLRGATSLIAADEPGIRPRVSEKLDYEAELAVVIGRSGRHVPVERALEHVFGYACFNDISVRDYQKRTPQWTIGKNFDGTGAFGPHLVTADEVPPGAAGLRIQCRLNGEVMQDANTASMIWGVAETIAILTECLTLEPGDVIVMGTPAGVGFARNPPVWMRDGDRVEVEIDGIGLLATAIRDEQEPAR
ncbi:2-keto-4-pentenoate hydratase/2-oxohepta-3-ene-1,7-dioic acid hydratase in catechol pathway [Azospirillum lipoferum]|uniref:Fumarylacetoacetate hydrolase family protein n=1 Tax=Azospirillum lipoferum TaxID=193 RepID=A0A5A9G969_AZOLI|nr:MULTISPECIES: fumarylacetoacetate hydrolase family protein [Azospirillum]KAA0590254.1 fumarylacetoacetate hydrolase family protein [Azospirillum lipoferum]MCP1614992.1 2-keto-4-pentenoate hydratase/2-oxohepta-3-ene-1,7-dioic acid hydratase in catechol pathway [Azospirillum lipoferum]MDW5532463.1 fumarylacetoacetate hydrolase family protein [Azospirillum sp. NL1]